MNLGQIEYLQLEDIEFYDDGDTVEIHVDIDVAPRLSQSEAFALCEWLKTWLYDKGHTHD